MGIRMSSTARGPEAVSAARMTWAACVAWEQGAAVYQCSFNPVDNSVVCVTGDGICRFLRVTDQVR